MAEAQPSRNDIIKPSRLNPPIIMKIDSPVEDLDNTQNEEEEKLLHSTSSDEETTATGATSPIKVCSVNFRPSQLNPFTASLSGPTKSGGYNSNSNVLKPSQINLGSNRVSSTTNTPFQLKLTPSKLTPITNKLTASKSDNNHNTSDKSVKNGELPKFVPLLLNENNVTTTVSSSNTTAATAAAPTFVFGQNLKDRVLAAAENEPKPSSSHSSNGTSTEMLFSSVIKNEVNNTENNVTSTTSNPIDNKSLSESAREYEESRANKRKYDEVEVKTGEEEETNILSVSCKLFAFDKLTSSWQERGRGTLRLNDFKTDDWGTHIKSRLVFRTTGNYKVILNTKIWAEMMVERASEKSIRLTALDANGEIKVFLIMANIEDSKNLYFHLQTRVEKEIAAQKRKKLKNTEENSTTTTNNTSEENWN